MKDSPGKGNSTADLGQGTYDCVAAVTGHEKLVIKDKAEL